MTTLHSSPAGPVRRSARRIRALTSAAAATAALALAAACGAPHTSEEPVRAIRIAVPYDSETPFNSCGLLKLDAAVKEAGGRLDVTVYPSGVIASEGESLEQVVTGHLDAAVAGPAFLGTWYEPAAVMEAPYAFESLEEMNEAAHSEVGQRIWDGFLAETGVRVLDTWWLGARHLMTQKPVRSPADLKGVRMRVPDNRLHMAGAAAMGATPMPVPLGETYIGLQQGLISAVEGPINTSDSNGFQEVTDYITLTGHIRTPVPILINENVWRAIPETDRQILQEQLVRLGDEAERCVEELDAQILDRWVRSGEITVVEDADIDAFRESVRSSVPDQFVWADTYRLLTH